MARTYKKKRINKNYSEEDLKNALEFIRTQKWSFRQASSHFKIPLSTLSSHMYCVLKPSTGRPPALSLEEEKYLVHLITSLQEWGQLSTCKDVLKYAEEYIELMDLKHRFVNGYPTKDWYYGFLRRWKKDLKVMTSSTIENSRAKGATFETINGWFQLLKDVLTKLNIINKPDSIYNMDESGFLDDAGSRIVVVKRGTKYASQ